MGGKKISSKWGGVVGVGGGGGGGWGVGGEINSAQAAGKESSGPRGPRKKKGPMVFQGYRRMVTNIGKTSRRFGFQIRKATRLEKRSRDD